MKKLLLLFLLIPKTALAMDANILRIAFMENDKIALNHYGDEQEFSFDNTNQTLFMLQSSTLTVQALILICLKKKGHLFGKNVIPEKIITDWQFRTKLLLAFPSLLGVFVNIDSIVIPMTHIFRKFYDEEMFRIPCYNSNLNAGMKSLVLLSTLVSLTNLSYDEVLKSLIESSQKIPLILKSKIIIDPEFLMQQMCAICHEVPNDDAINPCDYKEHIYCKKCLTNWFATINNKKLACILCKKAITPENTRVEITYPVPNIKVTKKLLCKELVGIDGVIILFALLGLYQILECYMIRDV